MLRISEGVDHFVLLDGIGHVQHTSGAGGEVTLDTDHLFLGARPLGEHPLACNIFGGSVICIILSEHFS